MPELVSKYKIFIASPSDLKEERDCIQEVISELNTTYGSRNNIVLELIKWETNSAPAISTTHVQGIINNDVGSYDLFLGLLWTKFGTPTKEFGSGTEEEFNRAYTSFKDDNKSLQILFYFKNSTPHNLSDINPEQLKGVLNFKSQLGTKNVLYWEYNQREELMQLLRIHIPMRIETLKQNHSSQTVAEINDGHIPEQIEEYGIIDYHEIIEDSFNFSALALTRMEAAVLCVADEIIRKTEELRVINLVSKNQPADIKSQRKHFEKTANILNDFCQKIKNEIPNFSINFENGIDAVTKLVAIFKSDLGQDNETQIIAIRTELDFFQSQVLLAISNSRDFLHTAKELPRVSKEFNVAKKNIEDVLTELLQKLEFSYTLVSEARKNL